MHRVYKKGISIFLVILIVMGVVSGVVAPNGGTAHAAGGFAGGDGSASDPYQIATADQLNEVRNHLEAGLYFELTADIDLSSYANWEPIGTYDSYNFNLRFYGNMDGNGFKITNLMIVNQAGGGSGLFGANIGKISNVILEDIMVEGGSSVGGLVGINEGTISNSSATGSVSGGDGVGGLVGDNPGTISNSYATGNVSGGDNVGGLAGINVGNISNSYTTEIVKGYNTVGGLVGRTMINNIPCSISNSYATGSVNGNQYVGGLVGILDYFTSISNSYATGKVNGNQYVGGLVGIKSGYATINHSFYDSDTTVQSDIDKGTGKTTAEMQNPTTFSDWNFSEDWYMFSGQYPQLWAFIVLTPGTNAGTTKLNNIPNGMEYSMDAANYTAISGSSVDNITVDSGDEILVRVASPNSIAKIFTAEKINIKSAAAPQTAVLTVGTAIPGTTKLTGVMSGMEYKVNTGSYTTIVDTSVDNIAVEVGDRIYIRVKETTIQPASNEQMLNVDAGDIMKLIATGTIAGVTVPVAGATPVTAIADTTYTASIDWSPVDATFAGAVAYTAKITITPKAGYTLTGVPANSFTVAGAIQTTNNADSGVVIAEFPATATVSISTGAIAGVTTPIAGATPVTAVTYSSEYTATVSWSPATTLFAPETAYTATIAITPKAGYTLTGVPANFFTVAGATTTNDAGSGIVTAVFPATAAIPVTEVPVTIVPIATAGIAGVTAPVIGVIPVTTVTYSAEYTATVSWSPTTTIFVQGTAYTATITIAPKAGFTLTGVPANFFSVAGATTTNAADSGVVTAVFPATQLISTGGTSTTPSNSIVTSTNGTLTLPVNQAGEVSFENVVKISIPTGAVAKELILSIHKVLDTQILLANKEILLSPVYEITKNFAEDFSKPVTLNIAFDPTLVKSNQKEVVFYYDEVKKAWVEVAGGKIEGNRIIVEVNHLGKYAVLSVDEATGLPVRVPVTDTSTEINFSDVAGHWAEASIKQAVSIGMVKGYQDGTFQPNHTVTRAEFAVMLMNVLKPQGAGTQLTFTDTATIGAWAQTAIAQAVQAGMITGYEDGGLRPNAEITRAEMAVILAKALGKSSEVKLTTSFADDKDIPAWAKSSVDFVKQEGIVRGKGDNEFAPQDSATRAEAVTVLLKLLAQLNK
ncbi:S-layer homology domain-containing protein [Paenibacillus sp. 19GGS1-52]|uniref:S-layer homology domain-containing protein n=1 Tax=Paenibacillus sp. 19GGS1-52 TaxID=2758563 RepID=UPI001EFB1766|nr:S-layer homology domain-containing protein [Paenibacillus sp. 19GGS1-52]ULO05930.1 S-layer homology domain-containing protein [Paenibacillus sp. 19GGS1-52]